VIPSPGARRARLSTSIAAWLSARALSLSLAALAILVYGLDSIFGAVDMSAALQLDAARPLEVWRLITGHWTHWSIDHLFWAVLMFAVLGAELEVRSRRRFALFVICSALVISGHALWSQSALFVYRGLSGIDSALFVAFAIAQLRQPGPDALALRGRPVRFPRQARLRELEWKLPLRRLRGIPRLRARASPRGAGRGAVRQFGPEEAKATSCPLSLSRRHWRGRT
jgi:hypothetical protein